MKEIGVGLLGFGTVGAGVVEGLQRNADLLAARIGARAVIRRIADLDLASDRGVKVAPGLLTTDADSVIEDPSVDIVVELIGGTGVARTLMLKSLSLGKPVVTANKALLADHGAEIFSLANEKQTDVYFGASVGAGIPIIRSLREGLVANDIKTIYGILNGTCNYILTRMELEGLPFDRVLAEAQELGYAEADPSLDVDGFDTAHKAAILASLACGSHVPMESIGVEGIRDLAPTDIRYALDLGYRIKLLAVIRLADGPDGGVEARVHPALVPLDHMLASVSGVFNAVMVHSDLAGDTMYYGRGAGREPTASTVLADVADVVRNMVSGSGLRVPAIAHPGTTAKLCDPNSALVRYCFRLTLKDEPGVLARIADCLGGLGISIASALQKEDPEGGLVPVVLVTHTASQKAFDRAISEIDKMDVVGAPTVRIRIED